MKIAIVGATGTAGRATAHAAQQAGHEVIALSCHRHRSAYRRRTS